MTLTDASLAQRLANLSRYGASMDPPGEWAAEGACVGRAPLHDPRWGGEKTEAFQARVVEARAVCAGCPVRGRCYRWTAETPRVRVAGVLAGVYFTPLHSNQSGHRAKRTTFPVNAA